MYPDLVLDEELVRRMPLPLARLYRRAHNAKTPRDRHNTAYYLWEAALKLLGATAVVAYAENGTPTAALSERLQNLARPALGHWWEFVRLLVPHLADTGDDGFRLAREVLLGRPRDDLPRAAGLDAALRETLDRMTGTRATVSLTELFDRLVRYRNDEFGHGAAGQRPDEFYDRMGRALLLGVPEVLSRLDVLAGRRLIAVTDVRRLSSGGWLIERYALEGEATRRLESLERPMSEAARLPRPGRLYLQSQAAGDWDGTAWSLHPLIVYENETTEVFLLNARRGQRRVEYLDYHSGRKIERTGLDAEQRALLARVLSLEVDAEQVEQWAAQSRAEETPLPPSSETPHPRRLGEFELLSELGRGGMGVVYRAWQPSLGRQVALKRTLRPGDPQADARFSREIHVLGRVEHPHLVKVFTSGSDADQWFYAMELVEGATLGAVCERLCECGAVACEVDLPAWRAALSAACESARQAERPLSGPDNPRPQNDLWAPACAPDPPGGPSASGDYIRHIVELVRQVAEATHALHAAGVVHRDIKPGNILVTPDGIQAVLMDLGLAQLADDAEGRLTRTRDFVGTLRYASPEQVLSVPLDCRSDVYSLGVTLWEALALRPLFGTSDQTPAPELMLKIQHADPGRLRHFNPRVAADLEAIVLKCLEKDRSRRYATAAELADDLGRWLRGDLVTAQPLTLLYWAGKLARRYRWSLAAAATLMVLVASGSVYEISRSNRANEELRRVNQRLDRANQGLNQALAQARAQRARAETANASLRLALAQVEEQKKRAESALAQAEAAGVRAGKAADEARAINDFLLNDMLAQAAPELNGRQNKVTVEELLDRANAKIDRAFAGKPEQKAAVCATIGSTYWTLGEFSKAEPLLRRAWEIRRDCLGPENDQTLSAMSNLALVLKDRGKTAEAEALQGQVIAAYRRAYGPEHSSTLDAMSTLVQVFLNGGRIVEAGALQRDVFDAQVRTIGRQHRDTLISMTNLARVLQAQGKPAEAEKLDREAIDAFGHMYSPEHPYTLIERNCLAGDLKDQGRLDEAETIAREALEAQRRVVGPDHVNTLYTVNNLASILEARGKDADAEATYREMLEALHWTRSLEDPRTLRTISKLAAVLERQGKTTESEAFQRQLLEASRRGLGAEHPGTLNLINNLAILLLDQGKPADAESFLRELLRIRRRLEPVDVLGVANALSPLGWALTDLGRASEAEPLLREALAIRRKAWSTRHWATASTESILGACLTAQGRYAEAESVLSNCLAVLLSTPNAPPDRVGQALARVIALYETWGKPNQAAAWRLRRLDFDFPRDPFLR